ncbi:ATP-dependent RNA helicase mtr4 [Thelohanellus kitauei]|uniref:ATP-dependent RNA helicase mtr4 n=1 Tax=Thelohanellus kitauei TaxID=669202 RepID=A0A0C2NDN1_THEKT|nr:ATP-dependent RNA helicase mtr4 [Thelohanellus kitauei]
MDLNASQLAALLSCFTDQGLFKVDMEKDKVMKYQLGKIWDKIFDTICYIEELEVKQDLFTCERPIHPKIMEGMYEWALGCDFEQFLQTTGLQEGSLIRQVLRLDEICKEVEKAADQIGNSDLKNVAKACRESTRRDIVNTPSLYLID